MNSLHWKKGLKSKRGRGQQREKKKPSSVAGEAIIKIANCNFGVGGGMGEGWKGRDECKNQGTLSEASDRNDSQGCSGEKNPSGNGEKEMKQEFAALFKAFHGGGGVGDIQERGG